MKDRTALILIDIQKGCNNPFWGERNNPEAEKNINTLLTMFRAACMPIFHIQHLSTSTESPLRPGQSGVEFMDFVQPIHGEYVFQKNVNSAFIGTQLEKVLRKNKVKALVFVGISTDHCVSTTVRMAGNLGFKAYVIADATIAFERIGFDGTRYRAEDVHTITLASLHNEFATVINTPGLIKLIPEFNLNIEQNKV
ncbi:MAG: isochorismatase [Gammaproteobacteria bacterium RIFCSPHIGHO2_12_FULL_37_14]|nr:MAG: isochorismatase [Gammaproteobacteria bacterium RIFCSPHIGHO2_12_FULL_37_14]